MIHECRSEECGELYMGERERSLVENIQEHDKSVKEGDSKLDLSQYQVMTGYRVLNKPMIEGVKVIDGDPRNLYRKVKEAIDIKLRGATLNRTGGYDLPDLDLPLLREEETNGTGMEYQRMPLEP